MSDYIVKAEVEKTDKGLLAVASSSVVDRHGEVVSVSGWDLKNFKKNPVLLWSHDHTIPAIGVAKTIKVEGTGKTAKLMFNPEFHDITPEAKAIKTMFEQGILNSFSVGFKPIDMDGNVYTKQELLEISAVNVPANPDARMMAYKSLTDAGFDKSVIKNVVGDEPEELINDVDEDVDVLELKAELAEVKEQLADVVKGLKHLNPQGRKEEVVKSRLSLAKVIARATDKQLESKPGQKSASLLKVVKRANESMIVDLKEELKHGSN